MRLCRLTVACAAAALVLGAAEKKEPVPQTLDELQAAIAKVLVETKTPGAGIAIVTRDRVLLAGGIGKADVAAGRPAAADTLFRIGSVSKGFASLSILKLREQGRLSLDDPVRKYAPEIAFQNRWEATDPVRIVHLLEHTTGWDDLHLHEYASNDPKPLTLFEGLAYHPDSRVSRWRPGTRMAYCNAGPAVAAYIVEKISGRRFEDYVQQNFFGPLHMDTASYLYTPAVRQHLTTLYAADGVRKEPYWHITVRPSGAVNASPRDMAAYVRFYLNRGAVDEVAIVKPGSIERMEYPESTLAARDGLRIGYGLSNYATIDDRGFVWHGHNGGIQGGLTEMAYLPDAGIGYAYMINATNGEAFGRIHKLVTAFLTRNLPAPVLPAPATVPTALAAQYTGWGEPANPRGQMTYFIGRIMGLNRITLRGRSLVLAPLQGPPRTFVPVTDRLWREEKKPVPTLALISDTRDGRFLQAGAMWKIIPAWEAWGEIGGTALVIALFATSLLYAVFWIPALLLHRLRPLRGSRLYLSVRALPLAAILWLLACAGVFALAGEDALGRLGHVTPWSASVFVLTILFAVTSLAALVQAWRARLWPIRRAVLVHSLLAAACVAATVYFAWWGVIGFRTWS
jgi:CubicO group peptidase (beta-lactamase class C family)